MGDTCLHVAARYNNLTLVKILLSSLCPVTDRNQVQHVSMISMILHRTVYMMHVCMWAITNTVCLVFNYVLYRRHRLTRLVSCKEQWNLVIVRENRVKALRHSLLAVVEEEFRSFTLVKVINNTVYYSITSKSIKSESMQNSPLLTG